jgi:hypothetical protein
MCLKNKIMKMRKGVRFTRKWVPIYYSEKNIVQNSLLHLGLLKISTLVKEHIIKFNQVSYFVNLSKKKGNKENALILYYERSKPS